MVAPDPKTAKGLGRCVYPWNQDIWDKHLEEVAFEVVRQKFAASSQLQDVLLSTGTATLAEATRNDCIWGIGLNINEDAVSDPRQWRGRNVLGFALMRAREHLRNGNDVPVTNATSSASAGSVDLEAGGTDESGLATATAMGSGGKVDREREMKFGAAATIEKP